MRDREKGAALVWALLLLLFAGSLSTMLLARGQALDAATKTDVAGLKAIYAAEGGVALARRRLSGDAAYAGESLRVGGCDVTVSVEAWDRGWLVRSRCGGTTVEATLRGGMGLPAIESYAHVNR